MHPSRSRCCGFSCARPNSGHPDRPTMELCLTSVETRPHSTQPPLNRTFMHQVDPARRGDRYANCRTRAEFVRDGLSCYHCSIRGGVIQEISASTGAKSRKGCGDAEGNLMIDGTTDSAVCPACKARSMLIGTKNDYQIFQCENCAFLFVHPYPTPDEITSYYSSNYRGATANHYPKIKSRKRRALVRSLRFIRYIYGKKVLDIGCGSGAMVNAFRRLGADAHGADISRNSIQFARQAFPRCTFYCENFDAMRRRNIRFDFIFTSELLEHIAGPHECLRMIDELSKPGTVVICGITGRRPRSRAGGHICLGRYLSAGTPPVV